MLAITITQIEEKIDFTRNNMHVYLLYHIKGNEKRKTSIYIFWPISGILQNSRWPPGKLFNIWKIKHMNVVHQIKGNDEGTFIYSFWVDM